MSSKTETDPVLAYHGVTTADFSRASSFAGFLQPSYQLTDAQRMELAKEFARHREWALRGKTFVTQGETPAPQPYRLQAFWSPCRKYLVTVHAPPSDITLLDDDSHIWEAAGPEQDANTLGSPFVD